MNAYCRLPAKCTGQKSSLEVFVVLIAGIPCPFQSLMKRRQPGRRSHLGNIQFSHGSASRRAGNTANRREKPGLLKLDFVRWEKFPICIVFSGFSDFWKMVASPWQGWSSSVKGNQAKKFIALIQGEKKRHNQGQKLPSLWRTALHLRKGTF